MVLSVKAGLHCTDDGDVWVSYVCRQQAYVVRRSREGDSRVCHDRRLSKKAAVTDPMLYINRGPTMSGP